MNKTININLAGIFFHIDENAYQKLQHYLESVKRSFANTKGSDEIQNDIEARIAELFQERIQHERQVIELKEVEEVITIMGQPEDYLLDEEIYEDEYSYSKSAKTHKQLFRDTENSYIAGVSSGLGHYLGIDAIWVRLLWILLTLGSSGAFILIYVALWVFVPEAKSTADKLAMRGEPVNISNIEKKIKESFDDVSGKVKNINYEKYGYKARSGANTAATGISRAVNFCLKVFGKLVGIFILLLSGSTLIGLFIGLFTMGTFGIIDAPWTDYFSLVSASGNALWIISLLIFFAIGIPFFFLFILGLKILMKNLRSLGKTSLLVLFGLWIISILGLIFFGIKQASATAFEGEVVITEPLPIHPGDTLMLNVTSGGKFSDYFGGDDFEIKYNEENEKMLFSDEVRLIVRSTSDSIGKIELIKSAEGSTYEDAYARAENINYKENFENGELVLDPYLTTDLGNKYRNQEVLIFLYLPEGSYLKTAEEIGSIHSHSGFYNDILESGEAGNLLLITENGTECLDCPEETMDDEWENSEETWEETEDTTHWTDGIIRVEKDSVEIRIDSSGIEIN